MTEEQWNQLKNICSGEKFRTLPVGFIIDSPWLPGWAGFSMLEYYAHDEIWFETNLRVVCQYPSIFFLPGFWPEFGMCTEPSAFGCKCIWSERELPFAEKIILNQEDIRRVVPPNPRTDGLLPLLLRRLKHFQPRMNDAGQVVKFAVSRGPLNIASFLMGSTEFLLLIKTDPALAHQLLKQVTQFIIDWLDLQASTFPTIDGILILDDLIGFLGDQDFKVFAYPYLKSIFQSLPVHIKCLHNDANGRICAPYLAEMGINIFNFSFKHGLAEMQVWTNHAVTLLGNIPPRDVFGEGTPETVQASVLQSLEGASRERLILSCGGGIPMGVSTANLEAFYQASLEGA